MDIKRSYPINRFLKVATPYVYSLRLADYSID